MKRRESYRMIVSSRAAVTRPEIPNPLIDRCYPAVIPLLSRCYPAVFAAVMSLFPTLSRSKIMKLNQYLDDETPSLPPGAEQREPAPPAATPGPRGRPWVKGQSGNPRGRPSRARQAAAVAEALIGRKTVALTNKLIELALLGDRTALRLCLDRIAPARREPPVDLDLPAINSRADLLAALSTVADAAASGALTAAQSARLTQMLIALRQATW
jgi:hypothetical protein